MGSNIPVRTAANLAFGNGSETQAEVCEEACRDLTEVLEEKSDVCSLKTVCWCPVYSQTCRPTSHASLLGRKCYEESPRSSA